MSALDQWQNRQLSFKYFEQLIYIRKCFLENMNTMLANKLLGELCIMYPFKNIFCTYFTPYCHIKGLTLHKRSIGGSILKLYDLINPNISEAWTGK